MKAKKQTVKDAIMHFAVKYGKGDAYEYMLKDTLPSVVNSIIQEMFLQKFNSYSCSDIDYDNYKVILDYYTELHAQGFVTFESDTKN